jgi:flavodoxin
MDVKKVWTLYFSATGNTDKTANTIVDALARQLEVPAERISFTRPREREKEYSFTEGDLVVVASPTYAGKLPNKILPDFQGKLHGCGALAVAVCDLRNRSYDNAMAELCAVLEGDGFHTLAGAAFACRHAFTDALADGRPDWDDKRAMETFAGRSLTR